MTKTKSSTKKSSKSSSKKSATQPIALITSPADGPLLVAIPPEERAPNPECLYCGKIVQIQQVGQNFFASCKHAGRAWITEPFPTRTELIQWLSWKGAKPYEIKVKHPPGVLEMSQDQARKEGCKV